MPYIMPSPPRPSAFSFLQPSPPSSASSSSSSSPNPSPPPSPPRRPNNRPSFPAFSAESNSSSGRLPLLPRNHSSTTSALLTTPIPAPRSKIVFTSGLTSLEPSAGVRFPSSEPDPSPRSVAVAQVPDHAKAIVAAGLATSSGNNISPNSRIQPQSPPRALFYTGPNKSSGSSRSGGLRLDLGDIKRGLAVEQTVLSNTVDAVPTHSRHARSKSHQELAHSRPSSSFIRKKSGELVKPSLKQTSSSMVVTQAPGSQLLNVVTQGLPSNVSGSRSEPTTPTGSKSVHFDAKLEHVKLFLAEQKPRAVSRDGSPTETSEGGEDFFSYAKSSDDEQIRKAMEMKVVNMPVTLALGELDQRSADVRLESLTLEDDARVIRGLVLVRNLAFGKWVAARFTMDQWQTTSEVTARHVCGVKNGAYDRFEFFVRLGDVLPKIWQKTLELAIRFTCDGRGEMWDSNGGQNYRVIFKRKTIPVPVYEDSDDDEDRIKLKVADLKKSLEKVVQTPVQPKSHARGASVPVAFHPAAVSSPVHQHSPSFVNSQSAADVLLRVGKQGRGSPVALASPSTHANQSGPMSPRRNFEGTLTARYDFGSSLKSSAGWSSPDSVPFPRATSPVRSPVPAFSSFSSTPMSFSTRSLARGSPRDVGTPGPHDAASPPFRTSSDSDLPVSFSGAVPDVSAQRRMMSYFDHVKAEEKNAASTLSSPPMSRFNSFPPLSVTPSETPKTAFAWATGAPLASQSVPVALSTKAAPDLDTGSLQSSIASTPSITSNSSSAASSPSSPSEPLGAALELNRPDRGEYGQFAESSSDRAPGVNPANLSSFLDQYCFYTGPDSGLTPRRAHSTSSVSEYFVPLERSTESGTATPTRTPFKAMHSASNANGTPIPRSELPTPRTPTPVAG